MTWHPGDGNYLAAACMHNGCTVLKMHCLAACGMQAIYKYDAHESIAYDVEWIRIAENRHIVVSCSFYDNMLHFWNPGIGIY
jgi:diphthamide biosynthesis protein 7